MEPDEAEKVVTLLAIATNGWSDPKFEWWCQKLEKLDSFETATNVADRIADTHMQPGPPAWATFLQAYQSEVRTENSRTRGLPSAPAGESISLAEYVRRCKDRAQSGDAEAKRHLELFDRMAERHRKGEHRWIDALAEPGGTLELEMDADAEAF